MPLLPITLERTVKACATLPLDDRTIFACSYPKSGTTWLQNMLYELCTAGKRPLDHISTYCPFFENDKSWRFGAAVAGAAGAAGATGAGASDDAAGARIAPLHADGHRAIGWRIFNTHLWWEMMPKAGDARYIYLVRGARDVCASFYHHLSHQSPADGGYEGSLDDFVEDWCAGKIAFGDWPAHLRSWLDPEAKTLQEAARDKRVLVMSYESMKKDTASTCRAVAAHCRIPITEDELAAILPRLDIKYMRENIDKFQPKSVEWLDKKDGFSFVRKGEVGDSKRLFDEGKHGPVFQALLERSPVPVCARKWASPDGVAL